MNRMFEIAVLIEVDWDNRTVESLVVHDNVDDCQQEFMEVAQTCGMADGDVVEGSKVYGQIMELLGSGRSLIVATLPSSPRKKVAYA